MELGTVMSVAQTLFAALQCKELEDMCSFLGYKSQLDELQCTVSTIQAVFLDAETKEEEISHQAQLWIQELKDAVYDADDLFDEFLTLAKQKELIKGGKPSKEVRLFFTRYNPVFIAFKMSQGVKKIQQNLEAITKNHKQFGFKLDTQPIRKRRKETCSYVYENTIIGREKDVQDILGHMLDESNVKQDVSFVSIVGIGGLGKTALAQLLYNDPRVTSAFTLKLWTCVSDHDQQELEVQPIIRKTLDAATGVNHEGSTMEIMQNKLREKLTSNKYLLVLDDVWTENLSHWQDLVQFFLGGQRGSWIVVTTRSYETTNIVGGAVTHELQGLSKENSWNLFKNIAFGSEQSNPPDNLVKIGEGILEGCAGVPLAIRVAGSLLYGQEERKWLSVKNTGLFKLKEGKEGIIPILKLSYNQLESQLKSCFTYCALFPKDTVIKKELLINLWIANDYVVRLDDDQSIEVAAEEYYSVLLRRCFFQDVEYDLYGEIVSCKIHDLMHDVALKVAGKEVCISDSVTDQVLKKSRHLAYLYDCKAYSFLDKTRIRSYLHGGTSFVKDQKMDQDSLKALLTNWRRLRVLDLRRCGLKTLPESLGDLLHLRYLDLSENIELQVLPKSITKLCNLQSLNLCFCYNLKELPKDIVNLVNLRKLDLLYCIRLKVMPEGMSKLTCLSVLTMFVIDGSNLSQEQWLNQLEELKKLDKLKGELEVRFKVSGNSKEVTGDGRGGGAYLRGKEYLNHLKFILEGGNREGKERFLEQLQPHPNLKGLAMQGYFMDPVMRMPGWANNLATSLPNLIMLRVDGINVEYLTCLGDLRHLKVLELSWLENLEYIYEGSAHATSHKPTYNGLAGAKELSPLFPCLEQLQLNQLSKLKGWRNSRVGVGDNKQQQDIANSAHLSLPQLTSLQVSGCPDLMCILVCPNLKHLELVNFNRDLQVIPSGMKIDDEKREAFASSSSSSYNNNNNSKLSRVEISNVSWLHTIPSKTFQCLRELQLRSDNELKSLGEAQDVFRACSSSLRDLQITNCRNIESVWFGGLEHLIDLKVLHIQGCPNVNFLGEIKRGDGSTSSKPWLPLLNSLQKLVLGCPSQLLALENSVHFLVALQSLEIYDCEGLESLPTWMPKLGSLKKLVLHDCSPSIEERCQPNTGQDYLYIKHIPQVYCFLSYKYRN